MQIQPALIDIAGQFRILIDHGWVFAGSRFVPNEDRPDQPPYYTANSGELVGIAIATGAHEQAQALREVNTAVNQMDQITQQSASMVEETANAGRQISDECASVFSALNGFQVRKEPRQTTSPRRVA